jgi:hypothetical protein
MTISIDNKNLFRGQQTTSRYTPIDKKKKNKKKIIKKKKKLNPMVSLDEFRVSIFEYLFQLFDYVIL